MLPPAPGMASSKSYSAVGATSAPFGHTTVPHVGSTLTRPKYDGSRSGAKTGPPTRSTSGPTSTTRSSPVLNVSRRT